MREIHAHAIIETVADMVVDANTNLPSGVSAALDDALRSETNERARGILEDLVSNRCIAAESGIALCQDTGMAVFFCDVGQDVHIVGGGFEDAINEGVRRGYRDGYLRCSVVSDPLRRNNTGDNTPAVIHTRIVDGERLDITFTPKGFGSENMSAVRMFNPTVSVDEIEAFIASVAIDGGGNACPPVVLGVGLGGTLDSAAVAAKRALTREVGQPHPDDFYAQMERRILHMVNQSGVGPMGLGGDTTALAINIAALPTHIAGLPCVVNVCCHQARHVRRSVDEVAPQR